MKAIAIHEAKTNLSKYIKQAKAGKPVYIGSFGKNEVVLMATPKTDQKTAWGAMKGKFNFSEKQWESVSKKTNTEFEENNIFPL